MSFNKIVLWVSLALAIVGAFAAVPYEVLALAVLGLVIGFSIPGEEHVRVIVSALALRVLAETFATIPAAGMYVTAIIGNIAAIAAGAALMIIFRNIYARVKP